jgi:hypothetical protein
MVATRVSLKAGGVEGPDVLDLTAVIHENPEALVFKYSHHRALHARICGDCGYTELFVENPKEFYDAYKKKET